MLPLVPTRRSGLFALLLLAAIAAGSWFGNGTAVAQQTVITKPILALPTLQWDPEGVRWRYASQQTETDLSRVMAGLTFGMRPEEVTMVLPRPLKPMRWNEMPVAGEFSDEVRYTWLHMNAVTKLTAPVKSCFGSSSYIVVFFRVSGLFRISWRFLPDQSCPDVRPAASELYAAFVPIASTVAFGVHYHTGYAEVVDMTDPHAGLMVTQRWQMPGQ